MNVVLFKRNLKNKKYIICINDLRSEIIKLLGEKIKKKDNFFKYSTTKDLYNKSKIFLNDNEIEVAFKLYIFDIEEGINEKLMLDEMMDMYKILKANK